MGLNKNGNASLVFLSGLFILSLTYMLADLTRFDNAHDYLLNARLISARDMIVEQVRQTSEMSAAFRASISPELSSQNNDLRECLVSPAGCTLDPNTQYPVSIYVPEGSKIKMTTGSPNLPARYDTDGKICPDATQASAQCPFEVSTTFNVSCAGSPCPNPRINVRYEIKFAEISVSGGRKLPSIVSVSGKSNPLSKTAIFPPLPGYQAVLIRSDLIVVNVENPASNIPASTPSNPVISYLEKKNVTNKAFLSAVEQLGLTDEKLAWKIFKNQKGLRPEASVEEIVAYIKNYQLYGSELSRAAFSRGDLVTFEEMQRAIESVKAVESKTLAAILIEEKVSSPDSIKAFVEVTAGINNSQTIRAAIRADLRDRDRIKFYDKMLEELQWLADDTFTSVMKLGIDSTEKVKLIRDSGAWGDKIIGILNQSSITNVDIASAVAQSLRNPTLAKANAFNELITRNGITDYDVIHEAAWSRATTDSDIKNIVQAHEAARAEAALVAAKGNGNDKEVANRIVDSTSGDTSYVSGISPTVSDPGSSTTSGNQSSTTTVVTETTSGSAGSSGSSSGVSISSQLLSTCVASTCPLITF